MTYAPHRRGRPLLPAIEPFQALGPKLQIGSLNDRSEQEADAVAAAALSAPEPRQEGLVGRFPPRERIEAHLHETDAMTESGAMAPLWERGLPLPVPLRQHMEARFARDLSSVRIHVGREAERASSAIQARAFAIRNHVYFGRGEYRPGSLGGDRLLAHEVAHTLRVPAPGEPLIVHRSPGSSPSNKVPGGTAQVEVSAPEAKVEAASTDPAVEARARELTEKMLAYIKEEAKKRAATPKTFSPNSPFLSRLKEHYLDEYLAAPGPQSGGRAIEKIGAEADPSQLDPNDPWEQSIPGFTFGASPLAIPAATEILKKDNRAKLSHIDGSVLLGGARPGTNPNNDFVSDGANESQLMHWATGVKYSHLPGEKLQRIFVVYELMHLEGWGEFALDAVNDLIAEEQGRILGVRLRAGALTGSVLNDELIATFAEARAWVGSLLAEREAELEQILFREVVATEPSWNGELPSHYWDPRSIYSRYKSSVGDEEFVATLTSHMKTQKDVAKLIELYALIEESKQWQGKNRSFTHEHLKDLLSPAVIQDRLDQIKAANRAQGKP